MRRSKSRTGKRFKQNKYLRKIASQFGETTLSCGVTSFVRDRCQRDVSLYELARELGISEILDEEMPFEGGIFEVNGRLIIKLNVSNSPVRRRFTLAHEMGHILLAPVFKASMECVSDDALESACNAIAAELLMPAEEVEAFVGDLDGPSVANLKLVAQRFEVSLEAAARRLHKDLRLWRSPIGLWEWDGGPLEKWFVGKRLWSTDRPSFSAFDLARESDRAIRTREFFPGREYMEAVSLEVLNLGNDRLLGVIGGVPS